MGYLIRLGAFVLLAVMLVVASVKAGAAQQSDTMQTKAKNAENRVKSAAKETKAGVKDSWLTAKTKIALFADDRVKGRRIDVDTNDRVVTLRGTVDSREAKSAAEEIAKGIEGASTVKNNLQVVPAPERKAVQAEDKVIKGQVEADLSRDRRLKKIDVRADAGVVTLTGEVPSIMDSARASQIARRVPGVRAVKNDLKTEREG